MSEVKLPEKMLGMKLPGGAKVEAVEVDVPKPGPGQVLLKMKAASLCGSDLKYIYVQSILRMFRSSMMMQDMRENGKCITRAVRQDMAAENLLLFPGLIKKYIRDRHMHGTQQFREQNVKKQLI